MGTTQKRTNLITLAVILGALAVVAGAIALLNMRPVNTPTPQTPQAQCLTVNADAKASLQRHLQGGTIIVNISAVLDPDALTVEPIWYVAATLDDQGTTRIGIWWTQNDPTEPGDNAYLAANATAEVMSDYMPAPETSDAGIDAAEDCLP